jgi:hypothetical protein
VHPGDHLVVDAVELVGPVLGGGLAAFAGAEEQTLPTTGRSSPPSSTCIRPSRLSLRGTPSAYPTGTSASVVSRVVVQACPYDTPSPAGTRLANATRARSVIAGRSGLSRTGRASGSSP